MNLISIYECGNTKKWKNNVNFFPIFLSIHWSNTTPSRRRRARVDLGVKVVAGTSQKMRRTWLVWKLCIMYDVCTTSWFRACCLNTVVHCSSAGSGILRLILVHKPAKFVFPNSVALKPCWNPASFANGFTLDNLLISAVFFVFVDYICHLFLKI